MVMNNKIPELRNEVPGFLRGRSLKLHSDVLCRLRLIQMGCRIGNVVGFQSNELQCKIQMRVHIQKYRQPV